LSNFNKTRNDFEKSWHKTPGFFISVIQLCGFYNTTMTQRRFMVEKFYRLFSFNVLIL